MAPPRRIVNTVKSGRARISRELFQVPRGVKRSCSMSLESVARLAARGQRARVCERLRAKDTGLIGKKGREIISLFGTGLQRASSVLQLEIFLSCSLYFLPCVSSFPWIRLFRCRSRFLGFHVYFLRFVLLYFIFSTFLDLFVCFCSFIFTVLLTVPGFVFLVLCVYLSVTFLFLCLSLAVSLNLIFYVSLSVFF